jgi:putative membrane-bound dehydrogenase-like protein
LTESEVAMQAQAHFGNRRFGVKRPRTHRIEGLLLRIMGSFILAALATTHAAAHDDAEVGEEGPYVLHSFQRQQLTDVYYSEGANFGDINGDGIPDVVYGPYWFEGPDFEKKHEIFPPVAQPRQAYADHFFCWVHDFNGNGWNDILVVGFPGTPAYVYENPTDSGLDQHWTRHQVLDSVANESPQFLPLVDADQPALVCMSGGKFGYATYDPERPFEPWQFHAISDKVTDSPFMHGLGVGDIDGDGRLDVLMKDGWFQQPEKIEPGENWPFHRFQFTARGGADMVAYDVNGNGLNDVITSLTAHDYGLAWFEQIRDGDRITFREHRIMGEKPEDNPYGVLFTELHSLALVDMDGDGLKDIVTGKTYWSHHMQSPLWDAGAVVYWFKLQRTEEGVDWIPYQLDDESGIGRQLTVGDVNGNGLPDIVVGGMKGAHVLLHETEEVDKATWEAAQPQPYQPLAAGLAPDEAANRMTTVPGFRVQLAAGEPQIHQPVAMAFDHRNRLWVAEAHTYPTRAPEGEGVDKILIFEDTTGDGIFDSSKVFIEGLNLVSGLEVGFGGVWVGAAPYLLFIPDRDGDDVPDGPPEVLLDGFGFQDTHETLNGFIWGPDGWLYGCHGVFTHSRVGKPGTPDEDRVPLNAGIWRFHPQRHQFEVFAWGTSNPWGVDFNDEGQAFATACVIPHLFHMIQGGRYHRQAGQHFQAHTYDDIKTIADHVHYEGDIRDHAWWGHEPDLDQGTSDAGGGHAHCGAMIYLGDNWPEQYRNRIFMNNIHGNRVNQDILEPNGSGYVGRHGQDLVMANDKWFRGINLRYGADGTVYLIDWYDRNACHRVNPEIWDRSNGRIYRVSHGEPTRVEVDLEKLTNSELIDLQSHPNDWYVRTARRILQHRGLEPQDREQLVKVIGESRPVAERLRALWTLHAAAGLDESETLRLLDDSEPYVRAWAIQLELEDQEVSDRVLTKLAELAREDSSPVVRLYLASALQRIAPERRWDIAQGLIISHGSDADDHNLPAMYWYGIEPLAELDPARLLRLAAFTEIPFLRRSIYRRMAAEPELHEVLTAYLARTADGDRQQEMIRQMLRAFEGRVNIPMPDSWKSAYATLQESPRADIRDLADQVAVILGDQRIFPKMRETLATAAAPLDQRQQAMEILVRGRDRQAAPALQVALGTAELRGAAIRALEGLDHPETPTALLNVYDQLSREERRDAVGTLAARPAYARRLLEAVAQQSIPRTDLHAYHVRQILALRDDALAERLKEVWGEFRSASEDKQQQIDQYRTLLTPSRLRRADVGRGRAIFDKTCASCHRLFGAGEEIGPDITGSNRADLDYILENIVDPSAVVGNDYRMTVLNTVDGRVVSGLVQGESDSAVTIRTINDTVVVAKEDIDDRQLSNLSLMPEGLLDNLSPEEVLNLVAYLGSPTQVPPRGPSPPINPETGTVPQALEGESLRVISTTAGDTGSQAMGNFNQDRWSGNQQLWWTGAQPGDQLDLELKVEETGIYELEVVMTRARDYGIVQLLLNDVELGSPIDLFNSPDVITTGVLSFEPRRLTAGEHVLSVRIVGRHPQSVPSHMFGLDYVRLQPLEAVGP